ncbi:hypothetical protein KKG41_03860 [Patescibacteria group bacterium]|nr:hypothetical protein [Patescibacteria group bacterium]MBU1890660.1 hypothetical protein [Patescibacteria group bacterium]
MRHEAENNPPAQEQVSPEEWNTFRDRLAGMRDEIYEYFSKIDETPGWFQQMKTELSTEIKSIYDDRTKYLAWHAFVMGGTTPEMSPKLDFPGEHSIERFFQTVLDRINTESSD